MNGSQLLVFSLESSLYIVNMIEKLESVFVIKKMLCLWVREIKNKLLSLVIYREIAGFWSLKSVITFFNELCKYTFGAVCDPINHGTLDLKTAISMVDFLFNGWVFPLRLTICEINLTSFKIEPSNKHHF